MNQRAENGALDPSLNLRFWRAPIFSPEGPKLAQTLQPTPHSVVLQGVATPLSRLFLQFPVCSRGVATTPPPTRPIARTPCRTPVAMSQVFWTSKTLLRSRGWSSYTCECHATLRRPKTLILKRFRSIWGKNLGRPKRIQRPIVGPLNEPPPPNLQCLKVFESKKPKKSSPGPDLKSCRNSSQNYPEDPKLTN